MGDTGDEKGQEIKWRSQICRGETQRRALIHIAAVCFVDILARCKSPISIITPAIMLRTIWRGCAPRVTGTTTAICCQSRLFGSCDVVGNKPMAYIFEKARR